MKINKGAFLASTSVTIFLLASPERVVAAPSGQDQTMPIARDQTGNASGEPTSLTNDIIVTALKRSESVQSVPASITALSGGNLLERGITDVGGLQFAVPSVEVGAILGDTQITIRGIGAAPGGPSTAVYVDGVYQPIAALADLSATDVARVEVLRGPQGTLYGRNANAGSVNFISNAPTQQLSGYVLGQYESYNEYKLQGMVNVPIGAGIAARLVINYDDREDGFVKNVVPGQSDLDKGKVLSGRLRIGGHITNNLSIDLNFQGKRARGSFQYFTLSSPINAAAIASNPYLAGAIVPLAPFRTSANDPSDVREYYGLASLTLDWKSPIGTLKSITAYQSYTQKGLTDQDGTQLSAFPSYARITDRSFSEELNLSKKIGPIDGILGAFYLNERGTRFLDYPFPLGYPGFGLPPGSYLASSEPQNDSKSRAVYADLTLRLTGRFRLIGGARYSSDEQTIRVDNSIGGTFNGQRQPFFPPTTTCPDAVTKFQFGSTTGKLGAQYDVAQNQNVYATASTGYLDGGLNYTACPTRNVYQPEEITAYELGYKSRLFDKRVTFNIAAFYYDFRSLQVSQIVNLARFIQNAASSHVLSCTEK